MLPCADRTGVTEVLTRQAAAGGADPGAAPGSGTLTHRSSSMSAPTAALPHRHRPGTARAALSYRDFRWIWLGLFASNIGTWMQNFTLPAYIEDRTESAALVGLLVFTQLGPLLLLSIPAGVLADRFPRRPYLVVMQAIQASSACCSRSSSAPHAPMWTLFACSLAVGIGNALNAPAFQASVPLLVDRADLAGAVSLNSVMINGSRVLGPLLAAVLSPSASPGRGCSPSTPSRTCS